MAELIVAQNGDFSNGFVSETFGRLKTIGDKTDTLTNWARHYKMKIRTVHDRVGAGWDPVRALTTPPKQSSLNNA